MMLKRSTTESKPSAAARLVRAGLASLAAVGVAAALATGCLDRPVVKAEPGTSNLYVDQIKQTAVDKIDLLFMVDNSVSMQDKQEILKAAVPVLLSRLVSPICVDASGNSTSKSSVNGACPGGGAPEFSPIGDIHIGIVSSSLGSHGSAICDTQTNPDDKARMIGSMRNIPGWDGKGFLAWDSTGMHNNPPGEKDPVALNTAFQNMIASVGEHGCGYEASLEAWYRFLVDPEPPMMVTSAMVNGSTVTLRNSKLTVNADGTLGACTGCDDVLLAQRKAFLRPDSLVAIVMLSDENDCSIRDDGVGWFVGSNNRMPLSTDACAKNPNDPCCRSCAQKGDTPAGCQPLSADPVCMTIPKNSPYAIWDMLHDSQNLRCYNQHQRFGFDLLYDTGRYVSALKNTTIALQSTGQIVANPLYDSTGSDKAPRDPSLVFLAGIVGVPWQDIADDASLASKTNLTYLTAKELADKDRWPVLLGVPHPSDGTAPKPPSDPFMVETTEVRSGMNTIAQPPVAIVSADSKDPHANVINGHEQHIPNFDDLQYACTFPLATPKTCAPGDPACDCSPNRADSSLATIVKANSPLCQGSDGTISATQSSAKAYPGARELQVLKDLGDNAIVASICPKVTKTDSPTTDQNYGYNPAVGAIIERLKDALKGKCLPRAIQTVPVDVDHPEQGTKVLCAVVEAQKDGCNCGLAGRKIADPKLRPAVEEQLSSTHQCGGAGQAPCSSWCTCEIVQEQGDDLTKCKTGGQPPAGYCYIDDTPIVPDASGKLVKSPLLKDCPANQQHLLRFVDGPDVKTPVQGAVAFIACLGQSVNDQDAGN